MTNVYVNALFMPVCVCVVEASTAARVYVFMVMCVQRLMMVQVCKVIFLYSTKSNRPRVNCLNKSWIYWCTEALFNSFKEEE